MEVATVSMGPDDSRQDRDETRTEDVGLPDHEQDERRRRTDTYEEPAPGLAGLEDAGEDAALPAGEDDARRAQDTATGEQNP
jgi:hypothetical protein